MGKVTIVLGLFVFSFLAFGEGEYTPRITFEDIIKSQVGVIKKVKKLNKETKNIQKTLDENTKKVNTLEQDLSNIKQQQEVFSNKLKDLEKQMKEVKLNQSLKSLVIENEGENKGGKHVGFGKPSGQKQIIKNGPQDVYFCVKGVSYIRKDPDVKSVAIGASYTGDTLECLTPCGLEGNKFYWLHIINLRTGYKGYSKLDGSIQEGKCK